MYVHLYACGCLCVLCVHTVVCLFMHVHLYACGCLCVLCVQMCVCVCRCVGQSFNEMIAGDACAHHTRYAPRPFVSVIVRCRQRQRCEEQNENVKETRARGTSLRTPPSPLPHTRTRTPCLSAHDTSSCSGLHGDVHHVLVASMTACSFAHISTFVAAPPIEQHCFIAPFIELMGAHSQHMQS
jgi:hypothetical protein